MATRFLFGFSASCIESSHPRQEITAIAHLCGWKSSAALRSAFQSRYGKSMRDWRAEALSTGKMRS